METRANGNRPLYLRVLGIVGIMVLALFIAGVVLGILALLRRAEARRKPLHVFGEDPAGHVIDTASYRLRVWGKVSEELSLTLEDLQTMPAEERDAPLSCVVGSTDYATWRGVPIRDVIQPAAPRTDATHVVFRDDRGFSSSLSLEYVQSGKPILAYELNGKPLPPEHGRPLRVVAPDKWGYKWVRWVTSVELTDRGYEGTYESSGWSLDGDLNGPKLESEKPKGQAQAAVPAGQ